MNRVHLNTIPPLLRQVPVPFSVFCILSLVFMLLGCLVANLPISSSTVFRLLHTLTRIYASRLFSSHSVSKTATPPSLTTTTAPPPSLMSTKGQDSSGFVWDVLSTLPVSFQHTGAQVVRFLSDYVKLDESKGVKSFHWTEFKNAVDNLPDVDFVIEAHTVESVAPGPVVQLPTAFASILTQIVVSKGFRRPVPSE
ncbi:hypothetical protein RSAG8_06696, partial [Rhizoctonia solani AG-8 WAC10335]